MKTNQKQKNIPDGWDYKKMKNISSLITKGSSPRWQGFEYQKEGVFFVTSENVRDGYLSVGTPKFLSMDFHKRLKKSQLRKNDLLINIVGASIGRSCLWCEEYDFANINQAVCLVRLKKDISSKYILHFFQTERAVTRLLDSQAGSGRPNLSLGDIRDFTILLPSTEEQNRIVTILETWDFAIEKLKQKIAIKKEIKKGLMQELLTGKKRLPGFSGEWEESYLKEYISKIGDGGTPSRSHDEYFGGDILWIVVSDIQRNIYDTDEKITSLGLQKSSAKLWKKGSIILSTGATIGEVGILETEACTKQGITGIELSNNAANRYFYYFLIFNRNLLLRYSQGGTFKEIRPEVIKKLRVQIPGLDEQKAIAEILTTTDEKITTLEKKLTLWQEQKKYLLNNLVTGQIRTPENLLATK